MSAPYREPRMHGSASSEASKTCPMPAVEMRFAAAAVISVTAFLLCAGCGIKRDVSVPVSPKILQAKSASLEDVLGLIRRQSTGIQGLSSSNVKVSFSTGRVESGRIQEYRSAPGYILVQRPEALRLNIQNPLTKTTIIDLASRGDEFSIWYPRENKYFVGRNSIREFDVDGGERGLAFTARPIHIYQAVMPDEEEFSDSRFRISFEEDGDLRARYYVVSVFEPAGGTRLQLRRKVWIERSEMVMEKQQTYVSDGSIASIVRYSNFAPVGGFLLPLAIMIERPGDEYQLEMEFKSWRLNPELPDTAFVLTPPAAAQWISLKERTRPENP